MLIPTTPKLIPLARVETFKQMMPLNSRTGVVLVYKMHQTEFRQILRDAEMANAISPIVHRHRLSEKETEKALLELHIPRAANVARIIHR